MSTKRKRSKALRYERAEYKHPNARRPDMQRVQLLDYLLDRLAQRERENQMEWLTPQRCRELFDHYMNGEMAEPCLTWEQMELFDEDIFTGKNSRLSALDEMPWQIVLRADAVGEDKELAKLAEQQRSYMQNVFARIDNLEDALRALGEADFRGVAALEITGTPGHRMRWDVIYPHLLARPVRGGAWYYNATAAPTAPPEGLEELVEERVIIREAPPILLPAMFLVCSKVHGTQGWDAFLDKFGNPSIFAELPLTCTEEERAVYDAIVQRIVGEGSGTMPAGTKFQTVETTQNSADSFADRARWCKEGIITLCTGGLLTVAATADTGALAGGAHSDSLARLCAGSARSITAAVNNQFVARVLRERFGDAPMLVRFELAPEKEEDLQAVATLISTLCAAGYRPSAATVSEMVGFEVTEVQENVRGTMYEVRGENLGAAAPRIMNTAPAADPAPLTADELAAVQSLAGLSLSAASITAKAATAEKALTAAVEQGKAAAAPTSPA